MEISENILNSWRAIAEDQLYPSTDATEELHKKKNNIFWNNNTKQKGSPSCFNISKSAAKPIY